MAQQSIIEATRKTGAAEVEEVLAFIRSRPRRASQAGDGRERATMGNPGLSPADRTAVSNILQERHRADTAVAEKQATEAEVESLPETLEQAMGRILAREQVIQRLRKLTTRLYFERSKSFPELCGVYVFDDAMPVYEGKRIRLLCSMEWGPSPEWSMRLPEATTAVKFKRGWRDLYLKLVGFGYFTLADAERVFETTHSDRTSAKYIKAVQTVAQRLRERHFDVKAMLGR